MSLQIYFCGSVSGSREDASIYAQLIRVLQQYGVVPTALVGAADCQEQDLRVDQFKAYEKFMKSLQDCDVIVAEVTQASLGVGYELGWAMAMKKPALCLFRTSTGKKLSTMIRGAHNGTNFVVKDYKDVTEAVSIIKDYMDSLINLKVFSRTY